MKHRFVTCIFLLPIGSILLSVAMNGLASSTDLGEPSTPTTSSTDTTIETDTTIGELQFKVASGWNLQNSTTNGLTVWPIAATFDSQNNLIVAESGGVQDSVQKQLETLPHRVVRLLDTNRDGIYDERQIVAEQLPFPEGVLCVGNDILVSAPPQIIRLIDADGDGIAENRSVWHDGKTLTGCANDLHGPFLGPEGWLYWCKAAFAEQTPVISGPFPSNSTASHLYRKRLNDDRADRVMTGGMDNLVDITFDSLGERFFVATFLHHPGGGLRDGLGHAPYGAVYGKSHAVLQGHPRTGPLFTPMVELGPAAPAGILSVSDANFPKQEDAPTNLSSTIVAAQFNLQRVSMHQTTSLGAAFKSKDSDLVVSEQLDFHPVDVLQDIDGSLIVVDTGGWYDLCCPSSGSEHRIAPGGIYRLSPANSVLPPTNYHATWTEIQTAWQQGNWKLLLNSDQKRVRDWGVECWLNSGANVDSNGKPLDETAWLKEIAMDTGNSTEVRASAFWAIARWLERHDRTEMAPEIVKLILDRPNDPLQIAALNLISTYRWQESRSQLEDLVQHHQSLAVRRLAAECLGRIADSESIQTLLNSWDIYHSQISGSAPQTEADRTFQHAIFFALIEIATYPENRATVIAKLQKELQREGRSDPIAFACLSTLQQIDATSPDLAKSLLAALNSELAPLSQIAQEILATQPDCLQAYLDNLPLQEEELPIGETQDLIRVLTLSKDQAITRDWIAKNIIGSEADKNLNRMSPQVSPWTWKVETSILESFKNQTLPMEWDSSLASQLKLLHGELSKDIQSGKPDSSTQKNVANLWQLVEILRQTKVSAEQKHLTGELRRITDELITSSNSSNQENLSHVSAIAATAPAGSLTIPASIQQSIVDFALGEDRAIAGVAWQAISKLDLAPIAWEKLLNNVQSLPTNDYPKAIEALARSTASDKATDKATDQPSQVSLNRLISTVLSTPTTRTLSPEQIKKWFAGKPVLIQSELDTKLTELFAPPADMKLAVESMAKSLPAGDAFRGQDVYRSSKAACSACHRIGFVGGNLGPELTRIGRSRNQTDFIEAILYPSHRIEQGFSSTNILTLDDEVISGIVTFEDDKRIDIATSADKVISVSKSDIQERTNSTTSLMPAGIDKLLSKQELADLLAFLQQAK